MRLPPGVTMRLALAALLLVACESRYPLGVDRETFIPAWIEATCTLSEVCSGEPWAGCEDETAEVADAHYSEAACPTWNPALAADCLDAHGDGTECEIDRTPCGDLCP